MAKKKVETELVYNDDSVEVLEGLEGIRKRFDMYVGGKDTAALHLANEVVDNSVDEALNGYADTIDVEYEPKNNKLIIEDNGRGLPTGMHSKLKKPTIEVLFTYLHAGGKFNKETFKVSGGKNGIGVKATNALSSYLLAESFREGKHFSMEFSKGNKVTELTEVGKSKKVGTRISFIPDTEILGEFAKIDVEKLKANLELRTFINGGLTVNLKVGKDKFTYCHENGILDYLEILNTNAFSEPVVFEMKDKINNEYSVVFNYANESGETIRSFVNGIVTSKGTHETGFKMGLTTAVLDFIKKNNSIPKKMGDLEIKGEDVREGLYAVINLRVVEPQFRGQVKDELSNTEVLGELKKATHDHMTEFLANNPNIAKKLVARIIAFAKGRKDANAMKDKIVKLNNSSAGLQLPEGFTDSNSRDITQNEIIIIEGKSAGGNVRTARDSELQAVFPLKGKPLNTYNTSNSRILSNTELKELIKVIFGTTDLKEIDYENVRYGKIIFLADADDDGFHIVCLLLLFFFKHFPKLFEDGRIYIGQSPLYRITQRGKFIYFKNDKEYDKFIAKEASSKFSVHGDMSMAQIMSLGIPFMEVYNIVKNRHNANEEVLDFILDTYYATKELTVDNLSPLTEVGLEIAFNKDTNGILVEGLYNGLFWQNFLINEDFINDIKMVINIFGKLDFTSIILTKDKETFDELSYREVYKMITDSLKIERVRFKGLGEADAEELFETTLDPKKRDLIQVTVDDVPKAEEVTNIFFGGNPDLRKKFIDENL